MGVKVRKPKDHASWCVVIDHQGQRKMKAVGSREAAERVKRELEVRLALGNTESVEQAKPAVPTLSDYAQMWLKNVEQERKPSTAAFVTVQVRRSILLDKSRRIVYRMVDECDGGSPHKATRGKGESPSALGRSQP